MTYSEQILPAGLLLLIFLVPAFLIFRLYLDKTRHLGCFLRILLLPCLLLLLKAVYMVCIMIMLLLSPMFR